MSCVTVLPAYLKVLLIVMFETHCNICNICMLSFTVLPDFLASVFSSSFFLFLRFYRLYTVFVMVVLPFGVLSTEWTKLLTKLLTLKLQNYLHCI